MSALHRFKKKDKMCNVINYNYTVLNIMSRFGISLGFGEKTVQEVCEEQGVDCNTFLAIINIANEGSVGGELIFNKDSVSLPALVSYLKQAHFYFLDFCLPSIREKLCLALNQESGRSDVMQSVLMFFDQYEAEVRRHMEFENRYIFKYVEDLMNGLTDASFRISKFAERHNHIDQKLSELKNIIIKHCPQSPCNNLLNAALFDIFNCESDLHQHSCIEDLLFIPLVATLEDSLKYEK